MRRLIAFACAGDMLLGSLDEAAGTTGLLIVSGGNEVRAGAHRGMALLAARLSGQRIAVFRYDRRGVGDSAGTNTGYEGARDDMIAAAATFRAHAPRVSRLIGLGNCDGATALALFGRDAGIDAVILTNPWVVETTDGLPPPAAIRARYAASLRNPLEWLRLARGRVSFSGLLRGLRGISPFVHQDNELYARVSLALADWGAAATVVLAENDDTAIAYTDAARRARIKPRTVAIETASHSFAGKGDSEALENAILDAKMRYSAAS